MRWGVAVSPKYVVTVFALLVALIVALLGMRVVLGGSDSPPSGGLVAGPPSASTTTPTAPPTTPPVEQPPTSFKISSLNVLGDGHTSAGGNRKGWAPGATRMRWLTQRLLQHNVDVVGFQELQEPQYASFSAMVGQTYGIYPGNVGKARLRNSIAWRLDTWSLVSASWIRVPYFDGEPLKMPVVLLQNRTTGQQVYFANFHLPANARGNAERWRDQGTELQIGLIRRLRAQSGLPTFITGDMNEKEEYFCRMAKAQRMLSASGGTATATTCTPPQPLYVDWVMGPEETRFTEYVADRSPLVKKSTDHPMIVARAELPPPLVPVECPPTPTAKG
jgi:endonuclease/exonuclease/phosphatase family metal-dependent hydrolase